MDINNVYGSTGASLVESLYGQSSKKSQEENKGGVLFFGADSVTISDEAKAKLASMDAQKSKDAQQENADEAGTGAASGGGGGGGSSSENDSKIQSLKARLVSLQSSLSSASASEVAGISAQIAQVMGEIAALEAEALA
ncbi:hypothetical protein LJC59_00575 [Desulfovibrio sp. OttesenSCG-928-A18]|nr:hypothetical protein [Desulfovibrio sp. OttesenSCG-928-A18]